MRAHMSERSARAVRRIVEEVGDSVAIVSGRPMSELIALAGHLPVHLFGSHGWEQRTPDGHRIEESPAPLVSERLAIAYEAAAEIGWRDHLEAKPAAVMLHTRGLPVEDATLAERECGELWRRLFVREGVDLLHVDGGLELRASARDKGRVVRDLRRLHPEVRVIAYLGDDTADESAFEALRHEGVTVRVGADQRPTRALWRLDSPVAVMHFLERWADSVH